MRKVINAKLLLASLGGAFVGIVISELLIMQLDMGSIMKMGLYYFMPVFFAVAAVLLCEKISPMYKLKQGRESVKCTVIPLAAAVIAGFVIPAVGQWLIELAPGVPVKNVVIALDCSDSMRDYANRTSTTKMDAALDATNKLVSGLKDNERAALVTFSDDAEIVTNMTKADSQGKRALLNDIKTLSPSGGTDFDNAVSCSAEAAAGNPAAVIMVTDAEDFFADDSIELLKEKNLNLYLINVNAQDNSFIADYEDEIKNICESTGGAYLADDNIDQLANNMSAAWNSYHGADVGYINRPYDFSKGERPMGSWYYILVRVMMYLIMGVLILIAYTVIINRKDTIFLFSIIGAAITALMVELNEAFIGFAPMVPIMLCLFMLTAICFYQARTYIPPQEDQLLSPFFVNGMSDQHIESILK